MTILEAAARLGVAEHHVSTVDEHPAGHVATLRDGRRMLISATVARAYVPEVDDPAAGPDADQPAEDAPAKPAEKPEDKPKRGPGRPKRNY